MPRPAHGFFEFGVFRLETAERRLLRGGKAVSLTPKVFDTLVLLLENSGHLVTKDELLAALWPGMVVEEANLTKNIWLIRKALGDAEDGSPFIETVPKVGYRWVAPVRRGAAGDAPASDAETRGPREMTADGGTGSLEPSRSRVPFAVAGAGLLAIVALLSWIVLPRRGLVFGKPATPAPQRVRPAVAVLGFHDLSRREDSAWLSTALAEMVASELAAGERLRMVAAEDIAREGMAAPAGALSDATLGRLRRSLGADFVVSGAFGTVSGGGGNRLRLDVLVQDTRTGEVIGTVSANGMESDVFQLVSSLGAGLRAKFGLAAATASEQAAVATTLPRDPEAARLFAEGLTRQRLSDAAAARSLLEGAIEREPRFAPAHRSLSSVLSDLGYQARARDEAKKAVDLSGGLPRGERLSFEGRLYEVSHETEKAVETFRTLFDFFPDNLEYGLRLVEDLAAAGHPDEALAVLARVRALPAPLGSDPRIALAEAAVCEKKGDWPQVITAADSAIAGAGERGSSRLAAEAWLARAYALDALGRLEEKKVAVETAARLFASGSDANGEARATISRANLALADGRVDEAEKLYHVALATFQRVGNPGGIAVALSNLSSVEWLRGDYAESRRSAERVLSIRRELEDPHGLAWAEANLAEILADHGDIDQALRLEEDALRISGQAGDREYVLYAHAALGRTLQIAGRLPESRSHLDTALALSREMSDPWNIAGRLYDRAQLHREQGDIQAAEHDAQDALEVQEKQGFHFDAAQTERVLAQIRNDEGRFAEGRDLSHRGLGVAQARRCVPEAADARAVLAAAWLGLKEGNQALQEARRAVALLDGFDQRAVQLPVLLAAARVEAAAGNPSRARSLASRARQLAETSGWREYALEGRLVEAELDLAGERRPAAVAELSVIAGEARAAGFLRAAKEAEARP